MFDGRNATLIYRFQSSNKGKALVQTLYNKVCVHQEIYYVRIKIYLIRESVLEFFLKKQRTLTASTIKAVKKYLNVLRENCKFLKRLSMTSIKKRNMCN